MVLLFLLIKERIPSVLPVSNIIGISCKTVCLVHLIWFLTMQLTAGGMVHLLILWILVSCVWVCVCVCVCDSVYSWGMNWTILVFFPPLQELSSHMWSFRCYSGGSVTVRWCFGPSSSHFTTDHTRMDVASNTFILQSLSWVWYCQGFQ